MTIAPPPESRRTTCTPRARAWSRCTSSSIDWYAPHTTAGAPQSHTRSVAGRAPCATCRDHSRSTRICSSGMRGQSSTSTGASARQRSRTSRGSISGGWGCSPCCAACHWRWMRALRSPSNRASACANGSSARCAWARNVASAMDSAFAPINARSTIGSSARTVARYHGSIATPAASSALRRPASASSACAITAADERSPAAKKSPSIWHVRVPAASATVTRTSLPPGILTSPIAGMGQSTSSTPRASRRAGVP